MTGITACVFADSLLRHVPFESGSALVALILAISIGNIRWMSDSMFKNKSLL